MEEGGENGHLLSGETTPSYNGSSNSRSSKNTSGATIPLLFAVLNAAAGQFLVGYSLGVMNAPESVVFPDHTTFSWALAVSALAIGGPFGAIYGGTLADERGRRGALLIDTSIFLVGGLLQTFAPNMLVIIISRFIIGFAVGFSSALVPVYLGEMAPSSLRGALGTMTQLGMVIGIFTADLFAFPFATEDKWRYMFAVTPIVALIQLITAPFLLESPRWLLGRDASSSTARDIIRSLRGVEDEEEVEAEVNLFLGGDSALPSEGEGEGEEKPTQMALLNEMLEHPTLRLFLFSSLALQLAQQLSGINAVFYYSTAFFEGVIDNPLIGTTLVGGVNVLATLVALALMDRCGRKTLILVSAGGMFISCFVIVTALLGYLDNIFALLAVNLYVIFFELGLGPIPWLLCAELFSVKYVALAMSLSSQFNWGSNFLVGMCFPYMIEYLGPFSFMPFAIVIAVSFIFAYTVLPETAGTTPEQLLDIMTKKLYPSSSMEGGVMA